MTTEELTNKVMSLEKEVNDLKDIIYKDDYPPLKIFRKEVDFQKGIKKLTTTGGVPVVADGTVTFDVLVDGRISITTKNGIVTAISKL